MENEQTESKKKSSPVVMTIVGVVILTLLGAGGGWLVGGMIAPKLAGAEAAAHAPAASAEKGKGAEGIEKISAEANGIVQLDPITTNLAYPSTNWVRLEVALMFKGPVEVGLAEDIHQDIMAYVRTVSLQQLEGPRGFQYLKDDLQERVDLRSKGRVSKVMFRTFVIE
ncbi:flagellar basal body-associated FliL family protein [Agrobacterium tumefaciens]|uniref:flagellar basal body-associated FliL family protein n=1 Tax=Agrobacterium tumefaciens TaxID=358 RepID=UPI001575F185|nr:flagellar basal body-associated FliL family protein [Agrobacterium tumefaciens]NTZ90218.1 flagellar basal body-associated FliL family protein [Agrobacterium tumefaciens]